MFFTIEILCEGDVFLAGSSKWNMNVLKNSTTYLDICSRNNEKWPVWLLKRMTDDYLHYCLATQTALKI
jgi:hypothetical protein